MCGIAGIVECEPGAVDVETVHRMCQTIIHRGPDDEGIYQDASVGLGMRRLSIIDLAGGHQPIHNEDETVWIVFNGEIYNFPELRTELYSRGHAFYTDTDTEVIVHLYEDFGSECVHRLRGMFAFAIFDKRRRSLLLARDRLGIKPLHYADVGGRLLFGSEIKSILAAAPELQELNHQALLQYFHFGYVPDPSTAFVRIHKLPPGHLLEWVNGNTSVRQYWNIPVGKASHPPSEEDCLAELEHRLAEAVRIRLIADVPLGALLSGGTDSSTVVALMARASSRPVKTFSIAFGHDDFNESQYARLVAQRFGTEHHELTVEPDIEGTLHALTETLEEPFGDSSMLPTYHVCRMARQHVTVALSGDGGDELFAGYERYARYFRQFGGKVVPNGLGRLYRRHLHPRIPHGVPGRHAVYNLSLSPERRYMDQICYLSPFDRDREFFSPDFLAAAGDGKLPLDHYLDLLRQGGENRLSQLLYLDTKTYLPGDILTKVDRMSMLNSLEARVPLLDHLFVEQVAGLPSTWKFHQGQQKYIFKKLAERVGVPREVLYRQKKGFTMPLVHWMRRELKANLVGLILEPRTLQRGYFRPRAVRVLVDEHLRGRRNHMGRLWLLIVFELWHRNFLRRPPGAGVTPEDGSRGYGTAGWANQTGPDVLAQTKRR